MLPEIFFRDPRRGTPKKNREPFSVTADRKEGKKGFSYSRFVNHESPGKKNM